METKAEIILSASPGDAKKEFQALLDTLGLGLAVVLGESSEQCFDIARTSNDPGLNVTVVWARDPSAIRGQIEALVLGDRVNFGPNGHRLVSINKLDQVSRCLSAFQSVQFIEVLTAMVCAAGGNGPCDP